jgi:hypothetical protein
MSAQENLITARRWYEEMWSKPDLDVADEIVSPEYDPDWVHIPAKGPDQVKHEIRYFRSAFPDIVYEIVNIVGQDDSVWVRYKAVGTHKGAAWDFEPTNRRVEFEGVTIFTMDEDAKVIDRWSAFSFYDILVDLELAPPIWELKRGLKGGWATEVSL